jgi:hypothetical protein
MIVETTNYRRESAVVLFRDTGAAGSTLSAQAMVTLMLGLLFQIGERNFGACG